MKKIVTIFLLLCFVMAAGCKPANDTVSSPADTASPAPTAAATPTPTPVPTASPTPTPAANAVTVYVPDAASGEILKTELTIDIPADGSATELGAAFSKLFQDLSANDNYQQMISSNSKINSVAVDAQKSLVAIDLSSNYADALDVGAGIEDSILHCLADTIGNYCGADSAQITMDGMAYESGHIIYNAGDTIPVNKE